MIDYFNENICDDDTDEQVDGFFTEELKVRLINEKVKYALIR